jgi:hypothetical protein
MTRRPLLISGGLRLAGFVWAMGNRLEKQVPPDFVAFRRQEQMRRLRTFVRRTIDATIRTDGSAMNAARM